MSTRRHFATKSIRDSHVILMHQNAGRFRCRQCPKTFENKHHWEAHERSHRGEKPFECPICLKSFSSNQSKENHVIVVHQNAGRYRCSHCDRGFQIKGDKEIHERSHTGERPFDCPICLKSFVTAKSKNRHVTLVHENAGRLQCRYCNKTYQNQKHLEAHERAHTGEKPFACPVCPKKFNRSTARRDHMILVHENGGRLKCNHCERRFQTRQALEVHETVHMEEKPFACDLCERNFKSELQLKRHHASQHEEKKFKCDRCSKAFGTNANLTRHLLSHSEGSFQCELCSKIFKYAQLLRIHQRGSHGEKKFTCDQCGTSFGSRGRLNSHLRRVNHSGNRLKNRLRRQLLGHSTIQQEALGESHLTRAEDQNELEVDPDGASCSSVGAIYVDADESDESSSEGSDESGSEVQEDNEDEPSESDQESDQEEDELLLQSNPVGISNLKLVYDVEYQPPN